MKAEQEKLVKLREDQIQQEKEREEIRRLEFERLQQIQEEQRRLEQARKKGGGGTTANSIIFESNHKDICNRDIFSKCWPLKSVTLSYVNIFLLHGPSQAYAGMQGH